MLEFLPRHRPRRNRKSPVIRSLVQESHLHIEDLIYPLFVKEGESSKEPINSMPGIYRFGVESILKEIERACKLSIGAIALFPVIARDKKDAKGSAGLDPDGVLQQAIRRIKKEFPHLCVITDVALDPYSSHGHDGLVGENGEILNDETVEALMHMALLQAESGSDVVAPSDMMDGRVRAIRRALDQAGFDHVSIHSYAAKYASAFYGPFREALNVHLAFGDKRSYQMDPANRREAIREALLDEDEGADVLMVKPALGYLDVIVKIKEKSVLPISAFQVSGEYAMIMAASQNGWLDEEKMFMESLLCIKRAGADMIFTYAAPKIALLLATSAVRG